MLGTVLDGVPESIVLGLTVLDDGGVSVALLVAVLLSNLPEALSATAELHEAGWSGRRCLLLWTVVALVSGLAAAAGYAVFASAAPATLAFVQAFAGGAILCMLADTMMPEAFTHGGRAVGLATAAGFGLAYGLSLQG